MKRLDLTILLTALISLLIATGCNRSNTQEYGEPLIVKEDVVTECDKKFEFKVRGDEDTNVTIEYDGTENRHFNEFGVIISYDIITPCETSDTNGSCEIYIESDDGVCPDGYELSGSTSHCWLTSATCGTGTTWDPWTNICEVDTNDTVCPEPITCGEGTELVDGQCEIIGVPPIEPEPPIIGCGEGFTLVGDSCLPNIYIPAFVPPNGYTDCINKYTWMPELEQCHLDAANINPIN